MNAFNKALILTITLSFTGGLALIAPDLAFAKKPSLSKNEKNKQKKMTLSKKKSQTRSKRNTASTPKISPQEKERRRKALAKSQVEKARADIKAREKLAAKQKTNFFPDSEKKSSLYIKESQNVEREVNNDESRAERNAPKDEFSEFENDGNLDSDLDQLAEHGSYDD